MRIWVLIAALLWGAASIWWYTCNIKGYCGINTEETAIDNMAAHSPIDTTAESPPPVSVTAVPTEEISNDDASSTNNSTTPLNAIEGNNTNSSGEDKAEINATADNMDSTQADSDTPTSDMSKENNSSKNTGTNTDTDIATVDSSATEQKAEDTSTLDTDSNKNKTDTTTDSSTEDTIDTTTGETATEADSNTNTDVATENDATVSAENSVNALEEDIPAEDDNDSTKIRIDRVESKPSDTATSHKIKKVRIYFPYNSSKQVQLNTNAARYFDKVVEMLKADETLTISLVGHTDSQGGEKRNEALGLRRAKAIKGMLVKRGAPAARITTDSLGESKPIWSNKSAAGRNKNRRVELESQN
jgi:outer membrane protein OmpA-like peptidoglycan-associated protein